MNARNENARRQPGAAFVTTPYTRKNTTIGIEAHGTLSVAQGDDGRVLLHCFAGCSAGDVLGALDLTLADVMPVRLADPSPEARIEARERFKRNSWAVALRVLSQETTVVLMAAGMLRKGHALTANDDVRLTLAQRRIDDARGLLA